MRAIYTGLLIGFAVACYKLAGADHARFIIPLSVLAVAAWVAVGAKKKIDASKDYVLQLRRTGKGK